MREHLRIVIVAFATVMVVVMAAHASIFAGQHLVAFGLLSLGVLLVLALAFILKPSSPAAPQLPDPTPQPPALGSIEKVVDMLWRRFDARYPPAPAIGASQPPHVTRHRWLEFQCERELREAGVPAEEADRILTRVFSPNQWSSSVPASSGPSHADWSVIVLQAHFARELRPWLVPPDKAQLVAEFRDVVSVLLHIPGSPLLQRCFRHLLVRFFTPDQRICWYLHQLGQTEQFIGYQLGLPPITVACTVREVFTRLQDIETALLKAGLVEQPGQIQPAAIEAFQLWLLGPTPAYCMK
ncbi:MAG: hypothetical protein JNK48_28190 [Bryobacterales bacterium]|nr:hypothetical protein [Bryobacterales bacterium]